MPESSSEPMPPPPVATPRCHNCEAALRGRYCHACGQEDRDLDVPFRQLVVDWLGNIVAFDARVWRTLWRLFSRPGFLTLEYLAGRRARYVPPFRLYLFISLLFFLALGWTGSFRLQGQVTGADGKTRTLAVGPGETAASLEPARDESATTDSKDGAVESPEEGDPASQGEATERHVAEDAAAEDAAAEDVAAEDVAAEDAAAENGTASSGAEPDDLGTRFQKKMDERLDDPKIFERVIQDRIGQALFLLAPIFALYLRFLFRRRWQRYQHHLVFSLHVHSAAFVAFLSLPIDRLLGNPKGGFFYGLAQLAMLVYLFLALRKVYGESRWHTAWKMGVSLIAYLVAFIATLALAVLAAVVLG